MDAAKSIFISAGEPSGDMHGSSLMSQLNKITHVSWFGLGGDMMAGEGLEIISHIKDLAATGIAEVARKYRYFKKVLKICSEEILNKNPGCVILIDFPGFNLRLAGEIRKRYSGKIIYYISPQVWAWNENRVLKIKKNIDKMIVVFPFEVGFYANYGIDAEYAGHPLVKRISDFLVENKKTVKNNGAKIITLLPGSRNDEVKHHLPVLLKTIELLRKDFTIDLYISKARNVNNKLFDILSAHSADINVIESDIYSYILCSDLVMTKAGTSAMECSLLGTPFLIFYKTYLLNYLLLKPMVKIKNIGIINILTGENTIKEFIQKDFTPSMLYTESKRILTEKRYSEALRSELKKVWDILGSGNAPLNAAEKINRFVFS